MVYQLRKSPSGPSAAIDSGPRVPVRPTVAPAASDPLPAPAKKDSPPAAKAKDKPPEFEDSWARELRELKELAAKDPDAALARVSRMPEKHERRAATEKVCLVIADKDPAKAMTGAWNLELGLMADRSAESETLEILAKQWANVDLVKAFVWASALPPDEEARRDHIIKGIASAVSQSTPSVAARLVSEQMSPDSSVKVEATLDVLRQWAARDYAGAMAWAALFPEGPLRERGLEELAGAGTDPATAKPKPN